MKQIDNRQKQQIQMRAQKNQIDKNRMISIQKEKQDAFSVHEKAVSKSETEKKEEIKKPEPVHVEHKAGRNDPCPCGSGKKYKKCCLTKESMAS
ncbi:MAG: hypothetical protein A3G33_04530 [Omnitrophica bacterium RIFCSPLOWO2_12_FULL_44_17]|uniref:Preprotein translocase subunit SecA n=1 Tax=Candidatus Danuiimicrobium aquiferis TaxID=1801832 RepID=A0A1G1KQK3_9BACT|nr:MAG: hypothetical protein A3B72_10740 [Omnitrophica bacterium RIFCSPHIGHO2_02_FULL_45_28]OGW88409.1 MAG: hypothetical protein A3E74_08960 [Omnitrophica bacterium RIFCSPHIGHO2_12_FULL_44_12]OGW95201.1 MAG: hypothetical protein A3G33_04530 [Omnitrophica bacterium RIFCSPLOWO2_12_FULL_44_17]OGX01654.1 MAG: hypothetical protein A3J12_03905 [Omnitrophica bacterium RIFCSPLOWO2_02_FULL_44_11]